MMYPANRVTVVAASLFGVILVVAFTVGSVALQARDQTRRNGNIGRLLLAVSGCEATDTLDQCRQRQKDRALFDGRMRTTEVDCLTRRVVAGLPAPDPDRRCADQTPVSVYPG
jgi:hypothetical protein